MRHERACVHAFVRACVNTHAYVTEGDIRTDFERTVFYNWED